MFLLKLSFKNLTRHKRRTIITSLALAFGLMMFILMDSLLIGALEQSNIALMDAETGHGKVLTDEAFKDMKFMPLSNRVEDPDGVILTLESLGAKATKRVVINGEMIYTDDYFPKSGSAPIMLTAVDLETDNNVFNIFKDKYLVDGRFMEKGSDEVVIGSWLAEDVGAKVGSFFTLAVMTASDGDNSGYYQTIDVEVVGIIKVESPMVNRRVVYFPLDMADFYLDLKGSVTEVALLMPFGDNLKSFDKKVEPKLPTDLSFYTWREIGADYLALTEAKSGGSSIIIFLVIIIAMVGITNTMLMTINERQKELGMMRALGMTDRNIRRSFIFEAAGIGLIGSFLGVLMGCLANIPMVNVGLDYSSFLRDTDMGYRISTYIYGVWNPSVIFIAFILGIIIPVVVAIYPTKRSIRKSIPDCINGR
ncbi:ABC transporter permease [Thiospirochaeta perfilievii]|uniref:ABC transporter permease n=1 Tax=Thiospirochaeta perfilievii TaxID=252967 RepID=A0A5C1QD41_9SPIO|nr:FtsX-like permease family protein [Thiospirochaeta perfilievii]QEN04634.1 ABC transporter permease [Thiospirochaeta perfilievii]